METTSSSICLTSQDVIKREPVNLFSPSNPTPMETIFLSNIDQAVVFPVETVFFFQVPPAGKASSTAGISEVVKRAVAEELLVPYYFMAGRLGFDRGGKRLELLCNNDGVPFVSAVSGLSLKDLGDLSLPNSSFRWLVHRPGLYKSLAQTPIFTIQVTRFECGGFALGFMTNHSILDGKSASEMFHRLASICRGEEEALKLNTLPLHNDRTPLRARNPPIIEFPHEEYIQPQNPSSLPTSFTAQNRTSPSPLIFSKLYDHRLFHFTPAELKSLKQKAAAKCSTFEAIVAHIWKARTKAVFQNPDDFSTVLFAVDIRSKTSPPLPSGFVGNAVITAFASAKVGDLAEKPLVFCVERVKEARERVTDEYVRSVVDWLEVYKGIPATCNGNFYVSAWWKLGFGELDLGYGKAVHGGPVVSGNDEFVLLLGDGCGENGGGVNVWLGLERERMKKFMLYVYEM